jgi:hypothetical protein
VSQRFHESHASLHTAAHVSALPHTVVLVSLQRFRIDDGFAAHGICLLGEVIHQRIGLGGAIRNVREILDRAGDAVGGVTDSLK